ncbi:MAG: anthranilate synthase component I family protein, partial [Chitinophagaceae bacterium]
INEIFNSEKAIADFISHFDIQGEYVEELGLLGYTAFDAVKYIEPIPIQESYYTENDAPDIIYILYKYLLIFDHFRNELTLIQLQQNNEPNTLHTILSAIENRNYAVYPFKTSGKETSNMTDEEYKKIVEKAIKNCQRGDVFQVVLSRRFEQPFLGDDFMVYRMLRSINPSPYLFYFDFGGFRIFGSSPETHCKIYNGVVSIDPIAGTTFRTGDIQKDQHQAELLLQDPKENAEHVMLVDLARNDLSKNAKNVHLDFYKKIQYYSHVIHIVSRVSGNIEENKNTIKNFIDTFPAGTLSGAPKVRAMQLITEIEPTNRGIYGGCIGIIHFNGNINQAITIRTFVSRNNILYYQAGAGIVVKSNPEKELQEVNNKLGALKKAIQKAEEI